MIKTKFLFVTICLIITGGWGFSEEVKMKTYDLSKAGIKATIEAPEGSVVKGTSWGDVYVKKGKNFEIAISSYKADLPARIKEIKENNINKLKKFHQKSDAHILYESTVLDRSEFHFLINIKQGKKYFYIEDSKGYPYTKKDIELMLKSAKSLKLK